MTVMRRAVALVLIGAALIFGAVAVSFAEDAPLSRFQRAQRLAWDGERAEARALCREILDESPAHHDARILLARVLAWDKRYDEARGELHKVLAERPDYTDASRALADVELWSRHPVDALAVCDAGLRHAPADGELRYRRARALENLDKIAEARELADALAAGEPGDERYARLSHRLKIKSMTTKASLGYRYEDFQEFSDPWEEWSLSLRLRQSWGSLIPRVRHARRGSRDGEQFEVDAYPRLPGRMYAYVNVGYAKDAPFPDWRFGGELYKSFGGGWEASLGGRYLDFGETTVPIYTGSVGKYWGDWWASLRPTVTDKEDGNSSSVSLRLRRYFGSADTYLGAEFSVGDKPALDLAGFEEGRLDSARMRIEGQWAFSDIWALSGSVGRRDQEFEPGSSRESTVFSVSLSRRF